MQLSNKHFFRLFLLIIALILIFVIKTVIIDGNLSLDATFSKSVSLYANNGLTSVMRFVTTLGDHEIIIATYIFLLLIVLFVIKDKIKAVKIPFIGLSALGLMYLLKNIFVRERPVFTLLEASGYSFPSGHSLNSMVLYGLIIVITNRYVSNSYLRIILSFVFASIVILIGFSRIYLGVHYLTDVIAGFCFGILWLRLVLYISDF